MMPYRSGIDIDGLLGDGDFFLNRRNK